MAWGVPNLGTLIGDATGSFYLVGPVDIAQDDFTIACITRLLIAGCAFKELARGSSL